MNPTIKQVDILEGLIQYREEVREAAGPSASTALREADLCRRLGHSPGWARETLVIMKRDKWVAQTDDRRWRITPLGARVFGDSMRSLYAEIAVHHVIPEG